MTKTIAQAIGYGITELVSGISWTMRNLWVFIKVFLGAFVMGFKEAQQQKANTTTQTPVQPTVNPSQSNKAFFQLDWELRQSEARVWELEKELNRKNKLLNKILSKRPSWMEEEENWDEWLSQYTVQGQKKKKNRGLIGRL